MDSSQIKFIDSQAKSIYLYKSLRTKILKCNADIFFNNHIVIYYILLTVLMPIYTT
jgi:hypothetical protein